jgi:PAS domain S-box-containing protein
MLAPPLPLGAIRQPAFLYSADGRIAAANDRAEALAGRPLGGLSLAAAIGIFDVRAPDGTPLPAAHLPAARALAGEEAVDVPLVVTAVAGRTVHVLATAAPIRDGGEVVGALSIWQDVTTLETLRAGAEAVAGELQEREQEVDRQRRLLDDVLGALPYRVSLWGPDERLAWANQRFALERGEPREGLIGRSWRELGDPPDVIGPLAGEGLGTMASGIPFVREVEADGPGGHGWRVCTFLPVFGDSLLVITEEVTERRRAGDALKDYAERMRRSEREISDRLQEIEVIYDTAPIGLCVLDTDLRFVRLNRRFAEMTGVPLAEHLGRRPAEVLPGLGEQAEAAMRTVLETGRALELGVSGTTPGARGAVRHWNGRWAPLRDEQGAVVGISMSAEEVTGQRRAVAALGESEAKYRSLVDLSPNGIVVYRRGAILYANPAAARMLRAEPDALIGTSLFDHVHPGDRAAVESRIGTVLDRGLTTPLEELRLLVDGGAVVYAEAAGGPVLWEGVPAVQVIIRDITARKQTEGALRASEERLRLAQESANVAVWDWDIGTGVYTSTPEFFRLYGLEGDRELTYDQWLERVHPDDAARVETESQAALARGEQFDMEHRIVRPSGEVRWIAAIGRGVCDEQGALVRVLGVNIDITGRKEAELSLALSAEDLARSNKELQRFAYVASHDLQEPLRNIVSFSQLLERRYRGRLDQDADDYIGFIVEGGMRMQALIRDLLQLSRIETQAKPPVPTDASAVAADVVRSFSATVKDLAARITVEPLPMVMVDPPQLEQVLTNLVANAIKYRRPEAPLAITISARRTNGIWEFAVQDNGIGIEEQYFDQIFEMFRRLHTKDEYEGTGIGLAVVKKIVERHGGRVRVESTPGEGSIFVFTLPAA